MSAGFNEKMNKYAHIANDKAIIAFVMSPRLEVFKVSQQLISKYVNKPKLYIRIVNEIVKYE